MSTLKRTGFCSYLFLRGLGTWPRGIHQGFKDRAVRMVADRLGDDPSVTQWQAIEKIALRLGVSNESLRRWYDQHLIDSGKKGGITREEHEEIKRLKREVAQLRRASEILKLASAFFASELDHPGSK